MAQILTFCIILGVIPWYTGSLYGQSAVLTWHNDNARTGQNLQETVLTPVNVNTSTFGKLFTISVDGKVDAQPLYVPSLAIPGNGTHNVLYVATEHDSAYAFDADTGAILWHVSLLGSDETTSDDRGCFQVAPEIGITATPAIDLHAGSHGTIYMVAMSKDAAGEYHHRLHAMDLATGAEESGAPVEVQAAVPGTGVEGSGSVLSFDPKIHKDRAALLIENGTVYTSWGSHCDQGNYTGWVIGYDQITLRQTGVINLTPNGNDGGIWGSGAGPAADAGGNLYVSMGNGTFDTTLDASGLPTGADYGNSFVRLSAAGGSLAVTDYFTMTNTVMESSGDIDLGSGGIVLLPPLDDAQGNARMLAVGGGKDGMIYVVDGSNMGKFNPQATTAYQQLTASPVFSSPAWFNGTLYHGSTGLPLRAFTFANGDFAMTSQSSNSFFYPGTTPSISANGISNGIVWAVANDSPAVLHAYAASNLSRELYNSNQAANGRDTFGDGNKFIVPTVVNGKVYVGTTDGVAVFGLLNTSAGSPNLNITKMHTGAFAAGQSGASYTITVQNTGNGASNGTVTVTDALPATLTAKSISGTGWSCTPPAGPCTRSDALAAGGSYPAITIIVDIASGATGSVVNTATVSGGGAASMSSTDTAILGIALPAPFLTSPANGASGVSLSPILTWNSPGNATSYEVFLGSSFPPPSLMITSAVSYAPGSLNSNTTYYWKIVARSATGVPSSSAVSSFTTGPSLFIPIHPCRIADTRNAVGPFGGPALAAQASRDFLIPNSSCHIPANATAYSLNIAVVPKGPLPYLTLYPAGQTAPFVATLNSIDGRIKSNAAIVPAGANGAISIFATSATDVIIDINGYFAPASNGTGLAFYPLTPCRIANTQNSTGVLGGPSLAAGKPRTFPLLSSNCSVSANAQAYALNFTGVPRGPLGYITAWPTGQPQPLVASLNALTGTITANAVIVGAGMNGSIDVFASDATDLAIDITGYFAPPGAGGLSLYNVTPCRVLDTRLPAGRPPFAGILVTDVSAASCGVPDSARAFVLNTTAVPSESLGSLTIWPQGEQQPADPTLIAMDSAITNNVTIVPTSNGSVSVFSSASTHLILDVFAYFAP